MIDARSGWGLVVVLGIGLLVIEFVVVELVISPARARRRDRRRPAPAIWCAFNGCDELGEWGRHGYPLCRLHEHGLTTGDLWPDCHINRTPASYDCPRDSVTPERLDP